MLMYNYTLKFRQTKGVYARSLCYSFNFYGRGDFFVKSARSPQKAAPFVPNKFDLTPAYPVFASVALPAYSTAAMHRLYSTSTPRCQLLYASFVFRTVKTAQITKCIRA